jgi:hypothetical protein
MILWLDSSRQRYGTKLRRTIFFNDFGLELILLSKISLSQIAQWCGFIMQLTSSHIYIMAARAFNFLFDF